MLELPFSYGSLKLKWKSGSPNHHWSVFPSLRFDLFILFSLWADLARFIFGMCQKNTASLQSLWLIIIKVNIKLAESQILKICHYFNYLSFKIIIPTENLLELIF